MSERTTRIAKGGSHRDRHTWIQTEAAKQQWVPGPGAYKAQRDLLLKNEDETDTNNTIQATAPKYSFGKEIKETTLVQSQVKIRRNNGSYPKFQTEFNPGPGTYAQYSYMGTPSGGHRTSNFLNTTVRKKNDTTL